MGPENGQAGNGQDTTEEPATTTPGAKGNPPAGAQLRGVRAYKRPSPRNEERPPRAGGKRDPGESESDKRSTVAGCIRGRPRRGGRTFRGLPRRGKHTEARRLRSLDRPAIGTRPVRAGWASILFPRRSAGVP